MCQGLAPALCEAQPGYVLALVSLVLVGVGAGLHSVKSGDNEFRIPKLIILLLIAPTRPENVRSVSGTENRQVHHLVVDVVHCRKVRPPELVTLAAADVGRPGGAYVKGCYRD